MLAHNLFDSRAEGLGRRELISNFFVMAEDEVMEVATEEVDDSGEEVGLLSYCYYLSLFLLKSVFRKCTPVVRH